MGGGDTSMLKKISLTLSATWSFVLVFYIKELFQIDSLNYNKIMMLITMYFSDHICRVIILSLGTGVMVFVPFCIMRCKPGDNMKKAKLIELSDNSFIPTYLGYFFVAMSVDNYGSMVTFYLIIFCFAYISGVEYFNPIFLMRGYHIYKVESDSGVQHIIILKAQHIVRSSKELDNINLYRINNLTYIGENKK